MLYVRRTRCSLKGRGLYIWRAQNSLPFEGADLRTDGSPDSERMEPAKPYRLKGDTPGAWSKSKTGQGWVLIDVEKLGKTYFIKAYFYQNAFGIIRL